MPKCFIYILSNAAMPGLLKIGYSMKVPDARADELYTTGVPTPFNLEFYCLAEGGIELESKVHQALSKYRHNASREFFSVDLVAAADSIQAICAPDYTWSKVPLPKKRPALVKCSSCGAGYVTAAYCPKCKLKLAW